MKALLVDDHALFRDGLALLVSHAFDGIEGLQASSIAEALAHVLAGGIYLPALRA